MEPGSIPQQDHDTGSSRHTVDKLSSLQDLLDLALGTPEIGAVNFNHLHQVITEILSCLGQNTGRKRLPRRNSSDTNLPLIRRIEATDSFVQEIATSIKKIYSDIETLRNEPLRNAYMRNEPLGNEPLVGNQTEEYNSAMSRLIDKFNDYATKEDLRESIMPEEEVRRLIEERIHGFKHDMDTDIREHNEKVASLRETLLDKMHLLEEGAKQFVKRIEEIEECLKTKASVSALDGKCDKTEIDNLAKDTKTKNDCLQVEVNQLKECTRFTSDKLTAIESRNEAFTEQQKIVATTIRKFERDVEDMMDVLNQVQTGAFENQQPNAVDDVAITNIRARITDLQDQQCKFQTQLDDITTENKRKEVLYSDIAEEIKSLQETKADEIHVNNALATKSDKKSLLHIATMDKLDSYSNELDKRINSLTQQIVGNETQTRKQVDEIMEKFEEKMNRDELKDIRGYIDERFRNYKPKFPAQMHVQNIKATASRVQLQNANCISCDQTVIPKEAESSPLPYFQALPGTKSIRPVTTFELQHIRQHMQQSWLTGNKDRYDLARNKDKLQKEVFALCDVENFNDLDSKAPRPCGGGHTSVKQEQRNQGSPPMLYREEYTTFQHTDRQKFETDVMGQDGHVYKGRLQSGRSLSATNKKEENRIPSPIPPRKIRSRGITPRRSSKSPDSGLVSPTNQHW